MTEIGKWAFKAGDGDEWAERKHSASSAALVGWELDDGVNDHECALLLKPTDGKNWALSFFGDTELDVVAAIAARAQEVIGVSTK